MRLNLHTAPAAEPIAAADLEIHSRLGTGNVTALGETSAVALFISAVRQRCEAITRRQLITAIWDLVLDGFPVGREPIELPMPPLQSVTSITYTDPSGATQTLDPSLYRVVIESGPKCQPGFVLPVYGQTWPTALNDLAVVTIRFSAGYGATGASVPEGIRNWMLINVANLWENRETEVMASGRLTQIDMSSLADGLLEDYRIYRW